MKFELISNEKNVAKFDATVAYKDFDAAVNKVFQENRNYFSIHGFRKGKAPRSIVERMYGSEIFYQDALNEMTPQIFDEAVKELNLDPCDEPKVDADEIKKGEDILLHFTVELMPIPEIGDYSKLEAVIPKLELTEEMVDRRLKQELEQNARLVDSEDAIKEGDIANIDYLGEVDGVPFDGGKDEGHDLVIGSGQFIPGFEEGLIGKKKGEDVDVKVTFPEEYHAAELSGKEAVFHVQINHVRTKEYPALDDEFAKDVSEFDTLEEFKDSIRKDLEKHIEAEILRQKQNGAVKALVDVSKVDIPISMVMKRHYEERRELEDNLKQSGLTLEQYLAFTGMNEAMLEAQMMPAAREKVTADTVLKRYIEIENIKATEEELDAELKEIMGMYGADDFDKFKEDIKKIGTMHIVEETVLRKKAIDELVEKTHFIEKTEEELKAEAEAKAKKAEEKSEDKKDAKDEDASEA